MKARGTKNKRMLSWILGLFVMLQTSAQLLNYIISEEMIRPLNEAFATGNVIGILLEVWRSIGMSVAENWISFSMLLIISCVGYFLYNHIRNDTEKISRTASVIALSFANLVLCGQFYLADSYSQRWIDIQKFWNRNRIMLIVLMSIVALALVSIMIFKSVKRLKKISDEFDEISRIDSDAADSTERKDEISKKNTESLHRDLDDKEFAWKHPFLYAWFSYCYYLNRRRKIRNRFKNKKSKLKKDSKLSQIEEKENNKLTNLKSNTDTHKLIKWADVICVIIALLAAIFACCFIPNWDFKNGILNDFIDNLKGLIDISESTSDIILIFGSILYLPVFFILIFYVIYFVINLNPQNSTLKTATQPERLS